MRGSRGVSYEGVLGQKRGLLHIIWLRIVHGYDLHLWGRVWTANQDDRSIAKHWRARRGGSRVRRRLGIRAL